MPSSPSPLLTIPESLVSSTPHEPPRILSLSFSGLLHPPLRLLEDRTEVGSQLWPAGKALAGYLLRNKMEELAGKEMLVQSFGFFVVFCWVLLDISVRKLIGFFVSSFSVVSLIIFWVSFSFLLVFT